MSEYNASDIRILEGLDAVVSATASPHYTLTLAQLHAGNCTNPLRLPFPPARGLASVAQLPFPNSPVQLPRKTAVHRLAITQISGC